MPMPIFYFFVNVATNKRTSNRFQSKHEKLCIIKWPSGFAYASIGRPPYLIKSGDDEPKPGRSRVALRRRRGRGARGSATGNDVDGESRVGGGLVAWARRRRERRRRGTAGGDGISTGGGEWK